MATTQSEDMSRTFRILYGTNAAIITLGLFMPILKVIEGDHSLNELAFSYWALSMALSVTFCPIFLALNLFAAFRDKEHRQRYFIIAVLLLAWNVFGAYQLVYVYVHDIPI
jgi:hypothetical protein